MSRTLLVVLLIAVIVTAIGATGYLLVRNRQGTQPLAAVQVAPAAKQAAPVAQATVASAVPAPVAKATSAPEAADSDPCAGQSGRALALCQAKNKPVAKATGIPTITPFPTRGAIAIPADMQKSVEDVLRGQGVQAAQAFCEKQFASNALFLAGCKTLVGQLATSAVTPTPTPTAGGVQLLKAPDLGLFGQILGFVWGCWTVGWKVGGLIGLIGSILGQIVWILFWTFGAKAIAEKKSTAGAIVWPWIWRIARWVCVTPIALLDALVPDEWVENPPEFLQSVGALYAVLGFLKGRRGTATSGSSAPTGGRPPLRRRPK